MSGCGSIWKELQLCFHAAPEGKILHAPRQGSQVLRSLKSESSMHNFLPAVINCLRTQLLGSFSCLFKSCLLY